MRLLSLDPGAKNLAACVLDTDTLQVLKWVVLDTVDGSPASVHRAMSSLLEIDHMDIDSVVIESQPPKNMAMKRVEHYLQMYFWETHTKVVPARLKLAWAETHVPDVYARAATIIT